MAKNVGPEIRLSVTVEMASIILTEANTTKISDWSNYKKEKIPQVHSMYSQHGENMHCFS